MYLQDNQEVHKLQAKKKTQSEPTGFLSNTLLLKAKHIQEVHRKQEKKKKFSYEGQNTDIREDIYRAP